MALEHASMAIVPESLAQVLASSGAARPPTVPARSSGPTAIIQAKYPSALLIAMPPPIVPGPRIACRARRESGDCLEPCAAAKALLAAQARRLMAGARDIFGVAAAILVNALGR